MDIHAGNVYQGAIGTYTITNLLAEGGMGYVYNATDENGEEVIAKFPKPFPDQYYNDLILEKLKVEANILRNFTQENPAHVVKYIDESPDMNNFFLIIEKIDGPPVTKIVPGRGLDESEVIRLGIEMAHGLDFLHSRNTIHRDIKPDNIMIPQGGGCVIIDFGGAKQGMTQLGKHVKGTEIGSKGWTCPDQLNGKMSAECDIYALGRIMFYMATGIKPIRFTLATGYLKRTVNQIKPSASQDLSNFINEMADPLHRTVHTATDVINQLTAFQSGGGQVLAPQQVSQVQQVPHVHHQQAPQVQQQVPQVHQYQVPQVQPRQANEAVIVMQGITYKIPNLPGGTLISKRHDEENCLQKSGGCNVYGQGYNIFVGWNCPAGCNCSYNPAHALSEHYLRVWRDLDGKICVINNDSKRTSAINRGSKWEPMTYMKKEYLKDHDQVALLYNMGNPYMIFTFHGK